MVHVTKSRSFHGWLAVHELALATVNLSIKLEVSVSTYYKDMKGDIKCRKWAGAGS